MAPLKVHGGAILYYSRSPSSLTQVTFTPHQRSGVIDGGREGGIEEAGPVMKVALQRLWLWPSSSCRKKKTKEDQTCEATITTQSNKNKLKTKKKFSTSGLQVLVATTLAERQLNTTVLRQEVNGAKNVQSQKHSMHFFCILFCNMNAIQRPQTNQQISLKTRKKKYQITFRRSLTFEKYF